FGLKQLDLRSPLITGLSLSLLLRADEPSLLAVAGVIAILSKFVIRRDGKHVFNPAGFAIVALLVLSDHVWISPGQWGTSVWFASLIAFCAILVQKAMSDANRSEEHTSELQSPCNLVCRLLLEKKKLIMVMNSDVTAPIHVLG